MFENLSNLLSLQFETHTLIRMKRVWLIFICVVCVVSCSSAKKIETNNVVIFVPGFYGTRLETRNTRKTVWIDFSEAIFRERRIHLPVQGLERFPPLDLVPGEILDEVDVIPLIYAQDAYGSILNFLSEQKHELVPFPYDWRKNLDEESERLRKLILEQRQKGKKVWVIAHSMGGLVTTQALRYSDKVETWEGLEKVEGVLISGTPFHGVSAVFRNMNSSLKIALNPKIVDIFAYSTFESAYYLLPFGKEDQMIQEGTLVEGAIRNPQNWGRGWGLSTLKEQEALTTTEIASFVEYAKSWLQKSSEFNQRLHAPLKKRPKGLSSKIQFLKGKGTATVVRGYLTDEFQPVYWEKELRDKVPGADAQRTFGDGDGTVSVESAVPPKAWIDLGAIVQEFDLEHGALINDKKVQPIIQEFLARSESPAH